MTTSMKQKSLQRLLLMLITLFLYITIAQAKTEAIATWMSGSDTINQMGIYGTKGVADPTNIPGARQDSISWTDSASNFWLFGGFGHDRTGDNASRLCAGRRPAEWRPGLRPKRLLGDG